MGKYDHLSKDIEKYEAKFVGQFNTWAEVGEFLVHDAGFELDPELKDYFDYKSFGKDFSKPGYGLIYEAFKDPKSKLIMVFKFN